MSTELNYPIIVVFILYISVILIVGYVAGKVIKNISDYILGGRNLSGLLAALGAGASDMSQWLLMGMPGAFFVHGINQIWILMGCSIGAYINWQFVAKRLRVYTEVANDSLTMPAYFDNRFHDHSKILRRVTAIVILIFFLFYSAAGFIAGGVVTQNIFHISYLSATLICAAVIIIYTCIGGFVAISWVDFFQGSLMFFAILIVPCVTMYHLNGVGHTFDLLKTQGPNYFNAFYDYGWLGIISLLGWGLGYAGQPHIIVRFMAIRKVKDIPMANFICMTWMIFSLYGALFTGLTGAAYFTHTGKHLDNPETIFLALADILFNPWIAGFLIAAVLSAIMSTVSAQLLLSASALTEDFYRDFFRPNASNRELVIVARICVLIISFIAVLIAITTSSDSTILSVVSYAWSGLGASFGPVVIVSLYWPRMTREAAISGIIMGAMSVVIWELLGKYYGGMFKLYSLLPAFVINLLTIYFVSIYSSKPSKAMTQQFNLALEKITQ